MSSSDNNSHLTKWLPQLKVYRAAMVAASIAEPTLPKYLIESCKANQASIVEPSSRLEMRNNQTGTISPPRCPVRAEAHIDG